MVPIEMFINRSAPCKTVTVRFYSKYLNTIRFVKDYILIIARNSHYVFLSYLLMYILYMKTFIDTASHMFVCKTTIKNFGVFVIVIFISHLFVIRI